MVEIIPIPLITKDKRREVFEIVLSRAVINKRRSMLIVKPGTLTGNHYNDDSQEIYCLGKSDVQVKLFWQKILNKKPVGKLYQKKIHCPFLLKIPPNWVHTVKYLKGGCIVFILSKKKYDPKRVHKFNLIQ